METVYSEGIVDHLFSAILFGNRCAGFEQKNIDPLIRALTNDEAETHAYMCELQYDCLAFIGQEHFTTPFLAVEWSCLSIRPLFDVSGSVSVSALLLRIKNQ